MAIDPFRASARIQRCAATVVLACAAWEAFINEFIQWRGLGTSKRANFLPKLKGVLAELGSQQAAAEPSPEWTGLLAVQRFRNELLHYKAQPRPQGDRPEFFQEPLQPV